MLRKLPGEVEDGRSWEILSICFSAKGVLGLQGEGRAEKKGREEEKEGGGKAEKQR